VLGEFFNMRQKYKQIWAILAIALGFLFPVICLASVGHIVISQIQIEGPGGANDEFIELYNPTENEIDLTGWSLKKETSGGTESVLVKDSDFFGKILSKGYFLIAKKINYTGLVAADLDYSSTSSTYYLAANNTALLYDAAKQVTNKIGFGTAKDFEGAAAAANPLSGQVLARRFAAGEVIDTNDNAADFVAALADPHNSSSISAADLNIPLPEQSASSTSQLSSSTPATGTILISEILPNPSGTDDGNEAVELINVSTSTVSLDGWFIDGGLDDSDGTKAYKISGQSIAPGEFLVIIIPAGFFKFYNSSSNSTSDTAKLYFPDKTLADSVSYPFSAPDGSGWQNVDGTWLWAPATLGQPNAVPPPASSGGQSSGSGGTATNANFDAALAAGVKISEIMPNPQGDDSGKEWVELFNSGNATTSLTGWKLDNDHGLSTPPAANAYVLGENLSISPKSYVVVTIPAGKFSLANTKGDVIRLFRPDNVLKQYLNFPEAPENQSFGMDEKGEWSYGLPTPGFASINNLPLANVCISEILPYPDEGDDEFVEVFNASGTEVSLENFKLIVGSKEKIFDQVILASSSYYVLFEEDLPANLRNSGQSVILKDNWGRKLCEVTYKTAAQGQAFAYTEGNYFWTDQPTPGQENEIVLAASTETAPAKATDSKTSSKSEISYAKLYRDIVEMNGQLSQKIDNLQGALALLTEKLDNKANAQQANTVTSEVSREKRLAKPQIYIFYGVLILAAAALFVLLVWKYLWKKPFK
jgi:hypothetical protein